MRRAPHCDFGSQADIAYNEIMPQQITQEHLEQLIALEAGVHYGSPPPAGEPPFVLVRRTSPVLLSAPHGASTCRNNRQETWHQEEDYTAGLALLLAELCHTSVIATIWRTDDSDPNYHPETQSAYKRAVRQLVADQAIRWVIDLHGAAQASLPSHHLVDLGFRLEKQSLPPTQVAMLTQLLETRLGHGTVSHNVFPALQANRSITAFCQDSLGVHAVQIELKPAVRLAQRRPEASAYPREGPYQAPPRLVLGLMQALADFITWLQQI